MISVIIPVYNVKPYLDECVQSVIKQTYHDYEVILVDDGSTDGSGKICDDYAKSHSKIKVIHKSNGGLSDARNYGIKASSGEYITFLDSDDYILPDTLKYLSQLMDETNSDLVTCQTFRVNEDNGEIYSKYKSINLATIIIDGTENCMHNFLSGRIIDTIACAKLYKRSYFNDISFPVGKFHEDVFTTYKLIAKCKKIAIGAKAFYAYRIRKSSITQSTFSPKHLDAIEGTLQRLAFVENKFPTLRNLAINGVIYAANHCILRMSKSQGNYKEFIKMLQPLYRTFFLDYLKGNARIMSKFFACLCWINISFSMKVAKTLFPDT